MRTIPTKYNRGRKTEYTITSTAGTQNSWRKATCHRDQLLFVVRALAADGYVKERSRALGRAGVRAVVLANSTSPLDESVVTRVPYALSLRRWPSYNTAVKVLT